ncbi:hypothetical protein ACLB0R_16450 (plasmid) [Sphingomonas sp. GlSt437]|uniref:hypothetical protein n=1 Tax=Sphingomonas sp. GlSt437 TaxID=3389970 RepID=UPI003A88C2D6
MAKKSSALAGIFDDPEPEAAPAPVPAPEPVAPMPEPAARSRPKRAGEGARDASNAAPARRSSHPGKKPVLIHIPEDMHRTLRQLSVEEGGEPLTVVTERLLRQYLVSRGHTRFAP